MATLYTKLTNLWITGVTQLAGVLTAAGGIVGNLTGDVTGNVTGTVSGYALKSAAVTATTDGLTTGIIPAGVTHAVVTCSVNTKLTTLPAPVPGLRVTVVMTANGGKLRSSAPATIAINGGVGAAASTAIAANTEIICECISATSWKCWSVAADGVWAAQAAAA